MSDKPKHPVVFDAPPERKVHDKRGNFMIAAREIAGRVKPTRRRLDILSALATGSLPWGVTSWGQSLPLTRTHSRKGEYVLCCGHVLKPKEAQEFVSAGLLDAGETDRGWPALVITDAGVTWLQQNW